MQLKLKRSQRTGGSGMLGGKVMFALGAYEFFGALPSLTVRDDGRS